MSIDVSSRGLRRIADSAESKTQSAEERIPEKPDVNSQQEAPPAKLQNQDAAANSRKAESGVTANQLQSELLNQTNSNKSNRTNTDQAAVQKAQKMYGITDEQMQRYVVTGEQPDGLKKAINNASTKGEQLALNVVRAGFQKRAEYLRKNSGPNDKQMRAEADQLNAAVTSLTRNRVQIATASAENNLKLGKKQALQATKDLQRIGSEMEDQVNARLPKKSSH
jgi:hypothetical protein